MPLLSCLVLLAFEQPATAAELRLRKSRIGVLPPASAEGLPAEVASAVGAELKTALANSGATNIMQTEELLTVVADLKSQGLECIGANIECHSKIGVYAGLEMLLVTLPKQGADGWTVRALLVDIGRSAVIREVSAGPYADLQTKAKEAAATITRALVEKESAGALLVKVHVPGAEILIDGRKLAANPTAARVEPLGAGVHEIEVRADSYEPKKLSVNIEPGRTVALDVVMDPKPSEVVAIAEPPAPPPPEQGPSILPLMGGALAGIGTAALLAGGLLSVTGEMMFRIARNVRVDTNDVTSLNERRDQYTQGTGFAVAGIAVAGLGAVSALTGAGLLTWGLMEE